MKFVPMLLLLAACAPQQPIFKPVAVDMPVEMPCHVVMPATPDFPLSDIKPDSSIADKTRAALLELDTRKIYETELESQLAACQ